MSESGDKKGFFTRLFSGENEEDVKVYSAEEYGARELQESEENLKELQGFTVERAAGIIKELPPEVPREIAVRIVRQTLVAAGIELDELGRSTRMRETKLNSRVGLSQRRIKDLRERTDEVVSSLEEQIRKAREARDSGVTEERKKMEKARASLQDVSLVRDFFGIRGEEPEAAEDPSGDETQVLEVQTPDADQTQVMQRRGPLSEGGRNAGGQGGNRNS